MNLQLLQNPQKKTTNLLHILGVTILLSLTVFLNLVAETLPQVSDAIPLLGSRRSYLLLLIIVFLIRIKLLHKKKS